MKITEKEKNIIQAIQTGDITSLYDGLLFEVNIVPLWNENYRQNTLCQCGHEYHRHFDSCDYMYGCGCKYCECYSFKPKETKDVINDITKDIIQEIRESKTSYPPKIFGDLLETFQKNGLIIYSRGISDNDGMPLYSFNDFKKLYDDIDFLIDDIINHYCRYNKDI